MAWTNSDDFLYFSFGDFDSANFGVNKDKIYRTISDRITIELAPPMSEITAEIPGSDGQYYFKTFHKPRVFNVSFAFDFLTPAGLQTLRNTFNGKSLKELCFSEEQDKIYTAKATGSPNIKAIPFNHPIYGKVYKGEGTLQFTAYWPYARNKSYTSPTGSTQGMIITPSAGATASEVFLPNNGAIPAHFELTSNVNISKIVFSSGETITGQNIRSWNSKTGIVKNSSNQLIAYEGDGLYKIPVGGVTAIITHAARSTTNDKIAFYYYNWY